MLTSVSRIGSVFVLATMLACSGQTEDSSTGSADLSAAHVDGGTAAMPSAMPSGTIFTILMENHDYVEVVGSPNAPYMNSLIAQYGLATNYMDSGVHPSLPNYLTMISGAPQFAGGSDPNPTAHGFPVSQPNLGSQMESAGIAWRSYQESMGTPCQLTPSGNYAPKHDPFLYFSDMQNGANGLCQSRNVDFSQFDADLAAGTYRFMWITPNLVSDGHNPQSSPITGLKQSDAWASTVIPKIMASDAYKNGGTIFLTWDEAEGRAGHSKDQIPMIIISSKIVHAGYQSTKAYSHKSYLATVEDMMGLPRLATVTNEPAMTDFFAQ